MYENAVDVRGRLTQDEPVLRYGELAKDYRHEGFTDLAELTQARHDLLVAADPSPKLAQARHDMLSPAGPTNSGQSQ